MPKYKLSLGIGFANARQKEIIDTESYGYKDEDWEKWPQAEKDAELEEILKDWIWEHIDCGYSLIEDETQEG